MKSLNRSIDLSFVEQKLDFKNAFDIQKLAVAKNIIIPIEKQGIIAKSLVKIGDRVKTGQKIASYQDGDFAEIVATASGKVIAISKSAHLSFPENKVLSIEIETEPKDDWQNLYQCLNDLDHLNQAQNDFYQSNLDDLNLAQINHLIKNAGIIGMGGAGFPTHAKITPVKHLIINAVECEPLIFTDFCLMKQKAKEIIAGVMVVQKMINQSSKIKSIHLAIKKKNKAYLSEIIDELKQKNKEQKLNSLPEIKINYLSNNYPSGGEKQIVEQIFDKEIPRNHLLIDCGFLCLNVATFYAINQAINEKKACIERLVTLYNKQTDNIKNIWVRIGTPLRQIIQSEGLNEQDYFCIIGGPMMGFEIHNRDAAILATTNCIQIIENKDAIKNENYEECIRCGDCADACPVRLLPQELYWSVKNNKDENLEQFNLDDCIECGICDYVCPSNIPLVHHFRFAKYDLKIKKERRQFSELSKERFDFREYRLERAKKEREEKLAERRRQMQKNKNIREKKDIIEQAIKDVSKK